MALIQHDGLDLSVGSNRDVSINLQGIADGPLNAILLKTWINFYQRVACPDDFVMRQLTEQDQHLLCRKAMQISMTQAQALLLSAILRFNATAASVIRMECSEQDSGRLRLRRHLLRTQIEEHFIAEIEHQG